MKSYLLSLFLIVYSTFCYAANHAEKKPSTVSIFLDCNNGGNCFTDYVKQELNMLLFVRDRIDADVHVLNTTQYNTNGGTSSTIYFIGRNQFQHLKDTIEYFIDPNNTDDDNRKLLVEKIKIGLLPFITKTLLAQKISVVYHKNDIQAVVDSTPKDPWHFWVFQISLNGSIDGNKNYFSGSGNGTLSAVRETSDSKTVAYVNMSGEQQQYNDNGIVYKYNFKNYTSELNHSLKLNEHFGIGISNYYMNSIFSNYKNRISVQPRIEYSIFPYKAFNTKRLIVGLEIGPQFQQYYDTTVYLKTKEMLFQYNLSTIASYTQPWGSVNVGLFWSSYMHDLSKNQFNISGAISTRVAKGINFAIWGNYAFVHDQINIRKGDATLDQLLIRNRELLSSYNYNLGVGVTYRFGSKNNNAVFPVFKGLSYSINL